MATAVSNTGIILILPAWIAASRVLKPLETKFVRKFQKQNTIFDYNTRQTNDTYQYHDGWHSHTGNGKAQGTPQ